MYMHVEVTVDMVQNALQVTLQEVYLLKSLVGLNLSGLLRQKAVQSLALHALVAERVSG